MKQLTFLARNHFSLEETKRGILLLFEERVSRLVIYFNLLLIFINYLVLGLFYSSLPSQVPLFYSHPWGEEQLAEPVWLVVLPAGSLLVFIFNNMGAIYFIRQEKILSKTLVVTSFLVTIITTIGLMKIMSLIY